MFYDIAATRVFSSPLTAVLAEPHHCISTLRCWFSSCNFHSLTVFNSIFWHINPLSSFSEAVLSFASEVPLYVLENKMNVGTKGCIQCSQHPCDTKLTLISAAVNRFVCAKEEKGDLNRIQRSNL